jgi:hypothetical protein
MDNLHILFDKLSGSIIKISGTPIKNDLDSKLSVQVDEKKLKELLDTDSVSRLFTDFKAVIIDGKLNLLDQKVATADEHYNKLLPVNYIHRTVDTKADVKLIITSLDNRPVLKIIILGDETLKLNPYKNKGYVHLTDKNDVNKHYQTFEIDLQKFTSQEMIFDIDRCDYRKLFSNNISFYHRKKLNMVYTII